MSYHISGAANLLSEGPDVNFLSVLKIMVPFGEGAPAALQQQPQKGP